MTGAISRDPLHSASGRSPCEVYSEAASLRVDRELGRAEAEALEAHLQVCPGCRAKAIEAEAVSRVLKHWDAERARHVRAPSRLRLEVRAAVAESAGRRRRERRRIQVLHLAMAASVLLMLGGALALGLARAQDRAATRPVFTVAAGGAASAAPSPSEDVALARLEPTRLDPSPLTPLGAPSVPDIAWLERGELDSMRSDLLRYERLHVEQTDFLRGSDGEPGVWWTDRFGRARLISLGALALLQSYGAGNPEGYFRELAGASDALRPADGHVYGDPETSFDTGRLVGDTIPLPRERGALDRWLARRTLAVGKGRKVHLLTRNDVEERGSLPGRAYDLKRAVDSGRLLLREISSRDVRRADLVAIVRGTGFPIFVPAGELIQGGRFDRVVARDVWIPATGAEDRFTLPCRAVSTEGGSTVRAPRATGLVAGPAVRLALARQLDGEALLALVDDLVQVRGAELTTEFSLLAFYDHPQLREQARAWARLLRSSDVLGVVVTDDDGAVVGLDVSDLPREAAADVLGKILVGHAVEAAMGTARVSSEEPDTVTEPALVTLLNLLGYENTFRAPAGERGHRVRRAGLGDPRSRILVTILEDAPSGSLVLGSAYAR